MLFDIEKGVSDVWPLNFSTKAEDRMTEMEEMKYDMRYGYGGKIDEIREHEYPHLKDQIYLDHSGATPYPVSLIHAHAADLTTSLFSNPHSRSTSSVRTEQRIDSIRLQVLSLFNADPEHFDVVFVPNATGGIKLVSEGFCGGKQGWRYKYLKDNHTSLISLRELANEASCVTTEQIELWLNTNCNDEDNSVPGLFAYPAQSNFNGRRYPLSWTQEIRRRKANWYSLLDAASYLTTTPLDFSDPSAAPDFTVLSFYKIFGYPDLGAVIVRKDTGNIMKQRKFFGGGTVAAVSSKSFHSFREGLHEAVEDGTLPFHNIFALEAAIASYHRLYGSFTNISSHTALLASFLHTELMALRHYNGSPVCHFYNLFSSCYSSSMSQGPIITFNFLKSNGTLIGYSDVESLSSLKRIHLRTGGLCNAGSVEEYVGLDEWEVVRNFGMGHICGDDMDIVEGKATGVVRVSLGAMSTMEDCMKFLDFVKQYFLEMRPPAIVKDVAMADLRKVEGEIKVQSIHIYPIKSCHGLSIHPSTAWPLTPTGLLYDRNFFLISSATGKSLSQKSHPRMALIQPAINLANDTMIVSSSASPVVLKISLDKDPVESLAKGEVRIRERTTVCSDKIRSLVFTKKEIADFFTLVVGVECTLAMYHPENDSDMRYFKALPESDSQTPACIGFTSKSGKPHVEKKREIWLSNESPFLLISQRSVSDLAHHTSSKSISPSVFRSNFVLNGDMPPYAEDRWQNIRIGRTHFDILGRCRRCHMVAVDQEKGLKGSGEVYLSLSKVRKRDGGGVVFGVHMAMTTGNEVEEEDEGIGWGVVRVGDRIIVEM